MGKKRLPEGVATKRRCVKEGGSGKKKKQWTGEENQGAFADEETKLCHTKNTN